MLKNKNKYKQMKIKKIKFLNIDTKTIFTNINISEICIRFQFSNDKNY